MTFFKLKWKLLIRNAQPRFILALCVFWIFIFSTNILNISHNEVFKNLFRETESIYILFISLSLGATSSFFGRLSFSMDGSFWDIIMCSKKEYHEYIMGSYYFIGFLSLLSLLLTSILFIFINPNYIWIAFSIFVFHLGTSNYLFLYFSIYSGVKFELNKRNIFSSYGTNVGSSLLYGMILFTPPVIFVILNYFEIISFFPFVLIAIGMIGILLNNRITTRLSQELYSNSYNLRELTK